MMAVVLGSVALVSPSNLLEMRILRQYAIFPELEILESGSGSFLGDSTRPGVGKLWAEFPETNSYPRLVFVD